MPFSKFEPNKPQEEPHAFDATSEEAGRRAMLIRWSTWITWGMTALGFGFIVYWTLT